MTSFVQILGHYTTDTTIVICFALCWPFIIAAGDIEQRSSVAAFDNLHRAFLNGTSAIFLFVFDCFSDFIGLVSDSFSKSVRVKPTQVKTFDSDNANSKHNKNQFSNHFFKLNPRLNLLSLNLLLYFPKKETILLQKLRPCAHESSAPRIN